MGDDKSKKSIRISLDRSGFVSGLSGMLKDAKKTAADLEQSFVGAGQTIKRTVDRANDGLRALSKVNPTQGWVSGLRDFETRSLATAQRVGAGFRSVLGGVLGIGNGGGSNFSIGLKGGALERSGGVSGMAIGAGAAVMSTAMSLAQRGVSKIFDLADHAEHVQGQARQISTTARGHNENYLDPKQLAAEFYAVSREVKGISASSAANAEARFLQLTGDIDTARASLVTFAHVSRGTGAEMEDVSAGAAAISQQFKITDAGQLREVLASLVAQGKHGAIEMKDLASGLQRISAAGASMGLTGVKGAQTVGGLVQIARRGTGSSDQAVTAIENMFAQIREKSGELATKHKVKVFEGKGANKHVRNIEDILIDAVSKVGGKDLAKKTVGLQQIFGMEGGRAVNVLSAEYMRAYQGASGTHKQRTGAGRDALKAMLEDAIHVQGNWNDVLSDSANMQKAKGAKLSAAWEDLTEKVGAHVVPRLGEFVDALVKNPEVMAGFEAAIIATGEGLAKLMRMLGIELPGDKQGGQSYLRGMRKGAAQDALVEQAAKDSPRFIKGMKERDAMRSSTGVQDIALAKALVGQQAQRSLTPSFLSSKDDKAKAGLNPWSITPASAVPPKPEPPGGSIFGGSGPLGAKVKVEGRVEVIVVGDQTSNGGGARVPTVGPLRGG